MEVWTALIIPAVTADMIVTIHTLCQAQSTEVAATALAIDCCTSIEQVERECNTAALLLQRENIFYEVGSELLALTLYWVHCCQFYQPPCCKMCVFLSGAAFGSDGSLRVCSWANKGEWTIHF